MKKKYLFILPLVLLATINIEAQFKNKKNLDPSKYNRESNEERLKKIKLKLELVESDKDKKDLRVPSSEALLIKVLAMVSDQRTIALGNKLNQFVNFKPLLLGQNDAPFPYPPASAERIAQAYRELETKKNPEATIATSGASIFISPEVENTIGLINIADWYGKLPPGFYKVAVGFSFDGSNNIVYSSPITFEIY